MNSAPAMIVGRLAVSKEDVAADLRLRHNLMEAQRRRARRTATPASRTRGGTARLSRPYYNPFGHRIPRSDQAGSRFFEAANPDCIGRPNSDDDPLDDRGVGGWIDGGAKRQRGVHGVGERRYGAAVGGDLHGIAKGDVGRRLQRNVADRRCWIPRLQAGRHGADAGPVAAGRLQDSGGGPDGGEHFGECGDPRSVDGRARNRQRRRKGHGVDDGGCDSGCRWRGRDLTRSRCQAWSPAVGWSMSDGTAGSDTNYTTARSGTLTLTAGSRRRGGADHGRRLS